MKEGIALPERYKPRTLYEGPGHVNTADNLKLIACLKCPRCGHSDDGKKVE